MGEQDAITIRHNTALEVWGHKQDALNYDRQARMALRQKQSPLDATMFSMLGSGANFAAMSASSKK